MSLLIILSFIINVFATTCFSTPRTLVVTGEASGEHLAAWYITQHLPSTGATWALGSSHLQKYATHPITITHAQTLGVVGIGSQLQELWRLWSVRDELVDLVEREQITHAVLVDYPLVNLLLARRLHNRGVHVTYIAPPEMWLWGTWGLHRWLNWYCDEVITLYPFEQKWYANVGLTTTWHGWPRYTEFASYRTPCAKRFRLALLPGSRRSELQTLVPLFRAITKTLRAQFPTLTFLWVIPDYLQKEEMVQSLQSEERTTIISPDTRQLASCCAALSKPGTITLELALLHVPTVIAFRVPWLTYQLASWCAQLEWVGLPNIILGETVMPEYLQDRCTPALLVPAIGQLLQSWCDGGGRYRAMVEACKRLHSKLVGNNLTLTASNQLIVHAINT